MNQQFYKNMALWVVLLLMILLLVTVLREGQEAPAEISFTEFLNKLEADQVEVLEFQSESTEVSFEASKLKSSQVQETSGVAVRVVKGGRLGFASSTDASAQDKLIRNVLRH